MSMNERIYKIDRLLSERRAVPFAEFLSNLEISRATLKRDLTYMRDRLNAPIVYDQELGGYRFDKGNALQGVQYLFLFVIILLISNKFPKMLNEQLGGGVLLQKLIGTVMVCLGLYLFIT